MADSSKSQRPEAARSLASRLRPALLAMVLLAAPCSAQAMRVAFGDIPGIDSLNLLIALERARARGLDVTPIYFESEDVAAQAVLGGDADIGVGAPYGLIQDEESSIRLIYQVSTLRFIAAVDAERYQSWADLNGQEITVHSRGSGTEALVKLMADRHKIDYSRINYVPGSEVRAGAMLQGNIDATIVDASGWRMLQERGEGRFERLSLGDIAGTDEALYARPGYLDDHRGDVRILLEEVLRTWREINADPASVARLRARYGLLPDLPPTTAENEILPYYRDAVAHGMFPDDGGTIAEVRDDLELYATGGALQGEPQQLDAERFWNFEPLEQARRDLADG